VIDFAGTFDLPLAPEVVWDLVADPANFEQWWPWLSELSADEGGLATGAVWRGVVAPPVPWRLRLEVHFLACERPWRVDARVGGDCSGPASLQLHPAGAKTRAALRWSLEMHPRALRVANRLARPLLLAGHDALVRAALGGFTAALGRTSTPPLG
jgi:uncharacterized protein YndB with AHSA1/START domain